MQTNCAMETKGKSWLILPAWIKRELLRGKDKLRGQKVDWHLILKISELSAKICEVNHVRKSWNFVLYQNILKNNDKSKIVR